MLSACAFPTQVQRFGVEYNEALSSMSNEQTLLNVLRASKGMPTHFTSVSRFTGTLSMKASGSLNAQLRGSGVTRTATSGSSLTTATSSGTSAAPAGLTTTAGVVTTPVSSSSVVEALAEGVDLYTPQIGGELNSGTNFDVQVFDQQKFYQGILGAVPFTTIEMLMNQGFEPDLVANLLIARVDVYATDADGKKTGDAVASIRNDASDRFRFQRIMDCNALDVSESRSPATRIAPISRLDIGNGQAKASLEQLLLFDGDKFALSDANGISANGANDADVYVVKPGSKSRVPRLIERQCAGIPAGPAHRIPAISQPEAEYVSGATASIGTLVDGMWTAQPRKVAIELVFRSPEAVLRAVGQMVRSQDTATAPTLAICADGTTDCTGDRKSRVPLFVLNKRRDAKALVGVRFAGENYSIANDDFRSMQVITIIQQLINLQKESSDRALSVPVRAVP